MLYEIEDMAFNLKNVSFIKKEDHSYGDMECYNVIIDGKPFSYDDKEKRDEMYEKVKDCMEIASRTIS